MTSQQQAAMDELSQKSLMQIQCETAITWAYRAWAAYQMQKPLDAVEYAHEAVEHAALCGDDMVLTTVRNIVAFGRL